MNFYCVACSKETYVAEYLHWNRNAIHWDITFISAVHDWEMEILMSFLDLIYSIKIKMKGEGWMC